jgi:hypothetical protein
VRRSFTIGITATSGAAVLAVGGYFLSQQLGDGPTSVPSCSWPLSVRGQPTAVQTGLVKCYLRALATRDTSAMTAVSDPPAHLTTSAFALAGAAKSGVAAARFTPNKVASGTVDVVITFANGRTTSLEMVLANPASWRSWRLVIGSASNSEGPPAASP